MSETPPVRGLLPSRLSEGRARVAFVLTVLVTSVGLAWTPWLTAGMVVGAFLVALTVAWPVPVLMALLFLGPTDLSFLTGGFKGLLEGLGGLDMNGIRLVAVSLGMGLLVLSDRRQIARLKSPEVRWYLLFLLYAGATLAMSGDPNEGIRLLLKLAWPLLIFLTVSGPDRTPKEIERMTNAILIGATVLILINPILVLNGGFVVENDGRLRLGGAGIHQNPFSFYLLVVILLSLGRFATRAQLRYIVLATASIGWMALTLTRITMLAGFVALGAAGILGSIARRKTRPALTAIGLGGLIGLVLLPVFMERTFGYIPSVGELFALMTDPIRLYQTVNWQGRELFWGVLVASWMASPLFGLGLGSSSGILKGLFTQAEGQVAHNEYIRLGTDTGFAGIGLFLVAAGVWIRTALRSAMTGTKESLEYALPAFAVMLAWGVISITDNAFDYYAPFTQFAGFLVGASWVVGRGRADSSL